MKTIDEAIKFSLEKVDEGLKTFTHAYPHSASINNIYQKSVLSVSIAGVQQHSFLNQSGMPL